MRLRSPLLKACAALVLLAGRVHGAADRGEVLLDELSCTQCHQASPQAGDRFFGRQGPLLGGRGLRLTPQWLRVFLADPDLAMPGTTMPDMLHGMAPAAKAEAIEDLTHYLISREAPGDEGFECNPGLVALGRGLYHTVGCVACHAPADPPPRAMNDAHTQAALQGLQENSVAFSDLSRMVSVPQMAAFLRDPVRFHPAGRMPSLKLTQDEATAIAAYLLRDQTPQQAGDEGLPGVRYEYFEVRAGNLPNFDRLKVTALGSAATFDISPRRRDDDIALRFRGRLNVPAPGDYRFFTESDDGSRLLIDDKPVVDNDGIHPMTERSGSVTLAAGMHSITVLYFNAGGDLGLKVSWQGPGIGKEEIPTSVLSHPGVRMAPRGGQPFIVDPARAARGRALFAQLNCAACHQGEVAGSKAIPLADLTVGGKEDCLSDNPARGLPRYTLTPDDREAIGRTLSDPGRLSQPLDAHALVERTLSVLNCYACHERGQQGGPQGLRRDYFTSIPPDLDLGDEGRIPPTLTAVGAKLQEQWIGKVLANGAAVRPYFATRMPQFGTANVGFLAAAFLAADGTGVSNPALNTEPITAKAGRKLVGINGLACVACHAFAGHPSLGVPAMDLTFMPERLQTGWFHRYLIDPQSLRPGTRMPSFWPAGKAVNREVLGGDTEKQIAAVWTYLSREKSDDLPDGLRQSKMEIVADKQTVMYRNFIKGVGPRAIGVGFPEKVDLAFDAGDMRIALIWQGAFIDAGAHRTGRGMGAAVPPLGHDVLAGPPGPPFALLITGTDPWPAATGGNAGYRFRGYHLDAAMRPVFSYDFDDIRVTDYPVGVPDSENPGIRRTLSFETAHPPANLYMRAAAGAEIAPAPGGGWLVDGQLTLKFSAPGVVARQTAGKKELLVPVQFSGNRATLEEDYRW